ncbi:winged helix-turn-helix domain-containing protein [Streptomyces indonesiensis]
MRFHLLGPVGASVEGRRIDIGPARQRTVLAVLLVEAQRVVGIDQLIDRVWGEAPPRTVRSTLYSYITRIRAALQSPGSKTGGVDLTRQGGGMCSRSPRNRLISTFSAAWRGMHARPPTTSGRPPFCASRLGCGRTTHSPG